MNTNRKELLGIVLLLVGFTDNLWSWLTPLNATGAVFDSILILAGAYLLFRPAGGSTIRKGHRFWLAIVLIGVGLTDNVYSWLTPLGLQGATFDALLILIGGYLLFRTGSS